MNTLTIKTLDETNLELSIPENLKELTFGQLMKFQKTDITNFETLSILSGVPVDDLYNAASYDDVTTMAKIYIDLFSYGSKAAAPTLPKKVVVNYAGKDKTVNIEKFVSMEPAGAYYAALVIIEKEMAAQKAIHGEDDWKNNFTPSLESMAALVDCFLYCRVTNLPWKDTGREQFAITMPAADVLAIAQLFFQLWPKLSIQKPVNKIAKLYRVILGRFKTSFSRPGVVYHPEGGKSKPGRKAIPWA